MNKIMKPEKELHCSYKFLKWGKDIGIIMIQGN